MVELDPNLKLLAHIRLSTARGMSLKASLSEFCKESRDSMSQQISAVLISYQQNKSNYVLYDKAAEERILVLDLVWRGLKGESISNYLPELESELYMRAKDKLDAFLKTLPIKVLLVVMFFHFPALLILSLIPIMNQIMEVAR